MPDALGLALNHAAALARHARGCGAHAPAAPDGFLLEAIGVSKQFPGVKALEDVTLRLRPGSVHALMGENGAGKSTLMKVLAGVIQPSAGEIRAGKAARPAALPARATPRRAASP